MKLTKETVRFIGVGTILVDEGYETEIIGMREERNHIYVTAKCISSPISWMPGRVTYGSPIGKYYGTEIKKGTEKMKIKMQFEAGADGNYLYDVEERRIVAHCEVPEGASEDYGYLTMKEAIIKALEKAGKSVEEIEWWYRDSDILEEDASADCDVEVDLDLEEEEEEEEAMFEKEGKAYHFTENEWYYLVEMMDDEAREKVHCKMAPCTNEEFMVEYLKEDPDFESLLWTEFRINYNG